MSAAGRRWVGWIRLSAALAVTGVALALAFGRGSYEPSLPPKPSQRYGLSPRVSATLSVPPQARDEGVATLASHRPATTTADSASSETGGTPSEARTDHEDAESGIFPAYPGASPVTLAGEVRVDGLPVSASSFQTRASPAEVIAFHRRHFDSRPVDLSENPLPDGRSLFVLDVREGRRCVVTARSKDKETEVIRGCTALVPPAADEEALLPALPEDLREISRVDDRLHGARAFTWSGRSPRDGAALLADLRDRFLADGWRLGNGGGDAEDVEGLSTRTLQFHLEGKAATLSVGSLPGAGALVAIRILPGKE